ncbi:MAG TPA: BNR repeat-containing protein [Oceanipulchritudo sp.]|nr:BNR repeat-containing protein [Oceanipulchritudo sp.]
MKQKILIGAVAAVMAIGHANITEANSLPAGEPGLALLKSGDTVVDSRALVLGEEAYGDTRFSRSINGVSFQQDAVVSHQGYQYVGFYDASRQVCIARRKLPAGEWETIRFGDYLFKANDAHNIISIGICPNDGTIHLAFDHHAHEMHYRVSSKGAASDPETVGWAASLFSPVSSQLGGVEIPSVTYPRFITTPEGELQLCWRRGGSGDGDRMLADYCSGTGNWQNIRPIDSGAGTYAGSPSRCSYPNGYTYDVNGRLHMTWVWREDATQTANHDLMYAYSDDRGSTWKNSDGLALEGVPRIDSPGVTVVEIPDNLGLMNTHGQAVDSQGRIHTVMWHCTPESLAAAGAKPGDTRWGVPEARRYHQYWRDDSGEWRHRELPGVAGNRPKLLFDKHDNAYLIFGSIRPQEVLESGIYFPQGDLVIMAATASSQWNDWHAIHTEQGPFLNEMLYDSSRWKEHGILSILVQESPEGDSYASALRILDFKRP